MAEMDVARLVHAPAFRALRRVAAEGLGVQLVVVDSDGALAHRRGGVLEAVSPPCRAALFTPRDFERCDAFYERLGAPQPNPQDGDLARDRPCPFGLSARSVALSGGLTLVASGYVHGAPGQVDASALAEVGVEAPELDDAAQRAPRPGVEGLGLLDALLAACRDVLTTSTPSPEDATKSSPRMAHVGRMLERYASSDALVLITGETGAGKHHAAWALHDASAGQGAAFVSCRLGAVQPELLEATLFGHTRGAFTDASRASDGLLGAARGGTLLLEEVGELPERAQALLLRLLAERRYRPVGASRERTLQARLLATTRLDLREQVKRGALREDLYYRLDVLRLELPPLRERLEDLPALLQVLARARDLVLPPLSSEALRCLQRYPWPGNLHELAAEAARLAAAGATEVRPADLSPAVRAAGGFAHEGSFEAPASAPRKLADAVAALEREMIIDGLERTQGNRSRLAAELDISRTTLIERLHRFSLMDR